MEDNAGSYHHTGDEEVKYVVNEDPEDWRMHSAGTEDAGALNEGEYHYEEGEYSYEGEYYYEDGINYELECSYTCELSQRVSGEGETAPRRSAAAGHKDGLIQEKSGSSKSSEEDEVKVKPKTKKKKKKTTKGVRGRFEHLECSYTCDLSQQVSGEGETAPRRSAAAGHKDGLIQEKSGSSKSSEEDEVKVKPKTEKKKKKKTKGVRGQFEHLEDPPLDARFDPGYGGSYEIDHPEDARSQSISLVSSWLQDVTLGEHPETSEAEYAHSPSRRPPSSPPPSRRRRRRRHRAPGHGADMEAPSSWGPSTVPDPNYQYDYEAHQYDYEAHCYDQTPAYDPSEYQPGYYEDHQLAIYGSAAHQVAPETFYRPERNSMDKALKFMKTVKAKSIQFKNLAVPVLTPILYAVLEESKEQLLRSEPGAGRATPPLAGGPGRGPGAGRGRGRAPTASATQRMTRKPSTMPPPPQPVARGQAVAMRGPPRPAAAARA